MGARVYDSSARGFLSVDPIENLAASWDNNPYGFAGNDPVHALDPLGLAPATDQQLAEYRNSNGIVGTYNSVKGGLSKATNAVGHWFKNNWEYVAGGAMVVAGGVLIATGVGGPAGMMLVSAGADTIIQKATTGEVNWGQVAVSGAAGAVGFGAGAAIARTSLSVGAKTVLTNVGSNAAEGAFSGAGNYLTGSGPKTVSGLARTTAGSAALDGATGGIGHGAPTNKLLGKVEAAAADGCFVAGTDVLLADGSSKPIEDIETDDEVLAYNAETSQTEKRRVVRSYVHEDKPTYDVVLVDGERVTATSEHPFMVEGKGSTPVDELEKGDLLVRSNGSTVEVLSINATGATATVHNFEVEGLHNYHVRGGSSWLLVHNDCETVSLYKASQRGLGEKHFLEGYKPEDFSDEGAFFARQKGIADTYADSYGEGVIETRIPKDVYDEHFAMHERKYLGTPAGEELPIAPHKLDLLSSFPRVWHR